MLDVSTPFISAAISHACLASLYLEVHVLPYHGELDEHRPSQRYPNHEARMKPHYFDYALAAISLLSAVPGSWYPKS